jgi:hypothetical protein
VNTIYDLFFPQMLRNFKDTGGYEVVISCMDAVQAAQTFIAFCSSKWEYTPTSAS